MQNCERKAILGRSSAPEQLVAFFSQSTAWFRPFETFYMPRHVVERKQIVKECTAYICTEVTRKCSAQATERDAERPAGAERPT